MDALDNYFTTAWYPTVRTHLTQGTWVPTSDRLNTMDWCFLLALSTVNTGTVTSLPNGLRRLGTSVAGCRMRLFVYLPVNRLGAET